MRPIVVSEKLTNRTEITEIYFRDILKHKMLTDEEQIELAETYKKTGDITAMHKLVEGNLRFVVSVAKQYQRKDIAIDDLISYGNIGIIKAAGLYDATRGIRFISYAVWWIRQCILTGISEQINLIRIPINQVSNKHKINKISDAISKKENRPATLAEIIEQTGIPKAQVKTMTRLNDTIRFDDAFGDGGIILDGIEDDRTEKPDERIHSESNKKWLIQRIRYLLKDRECDIVLKYFGFTGREISMSELSDEYGLSTERIRQIIDNGCKRLKRKEIRNLITNS